MRSGEARAHLTNSLSASFRVGGGFGRQNSFILRDPASCSISTVTAPCAKPLQKLTAAWASALSDCGSHNSTMSRVVPGGEIGLRNGVSDTGCNHKEQRHRGGPSLDHHHRISPEPFPARSRGAHWSAVGRSMRSGLLRAGESRLQYIFLCLVE